jgi:hypothetical protein
MTKAIKINDRVRIIDAGEIYTNFSEMFRRLGFANTEKNADCEDEDVGTVFNIDYHEMQRNETVYAVRTNDGRECLISGRGIQLVEDYQPDPSASSISLRLSLIEARLDKLTRLLEDRGKQQTAVEWFADQLTTFDYDSGDDEYEILISRNRFDRIKDTALEMESKQNCK